MCNKKIKILFVILLFLFFLGISNSVFGFSVDFNETTYDLPDLPFSLEEHPLYVFGYISSGNRFAVGYPKDLVKNNKIFCSETDPLSSNIFRYHKEGTSTFGEWNWYYIKLDNLTSWSDIQTTSHGFLGFYSTGTIIYSSVDIFEGPTSEDIYFGANTKDTFTLLINTPIENLITGEYEELVASCNSRFDILDFTIQYEDEFSGQDISQMPILNRCFAEFSNNSYINKQYITKYFDTTVIRMPLIDILPKDNTFYYIYFYVHDTFTGQYFDMFYEYTTDFSDAGIVNIENIIKSNPNKDIVNSLNNGFVALEEQNKNIFSKIGDIFSLLNPLDTDHFFLYVALNKLIIPSDNFFNNWIADINTWLGDRFGLIYYPIELVIDFLTRIGDIQDSGNYIISWPNLDIFGETLIAAGSYDFNSLLTTQEFNNLHEIYLLIMDVIFYLLLVLFAKNAAAEVFGGRFSDEVIGDIRQYRESHKPNDSYKRNKIGFSTK